MHNSADGVAISNNSMVIDLRLDLEANQNTKSTQITAYFREVTE
jgi:hypothetical protein